MRVLGINSVFHESSAALVVDGRLIAAAEEERFTRRKHAKHADVDNAHELPEHAIAYCLQQSALRPSDLDAVCYSFDPELLTREFVADVHADDAGWGSSAGNRKFTESLASVPHTLSTLLDEDLRDRVRWVGHHEAHAASAYLPSGFGACGVLVVDGIGEQVTALLGHWDGVRLDVLRRLKFPDSLGFLWERMSTLLGFTEYDACKVMGLAAYGDPQRFRAEMQKLVSVDASGFAIDDDTAQFRNPSSDVLEELFGCGPLSSGPARADVAAALQDITDEIMMGLTRSIHDWRPTRGLCVAGGVGLNCHTNWRLLHDGPFEQLYLPSAPHDAGTAIGAALVASDSVGVDSAQLRVPYLGPEFNDADLQTAIRQHNLPAVRLRDVDQVAELLAAGHVVAWFQGRMEFGPRALGNRSLLADPRDPATREVLNDKVKHREPFRPFAPSVLEEHAAEWFELARASDSYEYMSFACPLRDSRAARVPAVTHADGTARIQIVTRDRNPRFHDLISRFHARTGVPMVLNTSFNDSEPIVCDPDDALNTFLSTRIDALVLGDHLVRR